MILRFLRPNAWKILCALALFFVSSMLWRMYVVSHISDTFPSGFPFQYYLGWGPCQAGEDCSEFNGIYLVLDLLIWYGVGAFLVDRVLKRK
jgi:hypothetical protein